MHDQIYITHINTYKTGLYDRKMMKFTQMNEVKVISYTNYTLNKRGTDTIHAVSVTKYHNHYLILILKHANVLAELIKLHGVHL